MMDDGDGGDGGDAGTATRAAVVALSIPQQEERQRNGQDQKNKTTNTKLLDLNSKTDMLVFQEFIST